MLNAKSIIELGDREDDAPGYSHGAALVGVVDVIQFGAFFGTGSAIRTNVITVNLDALDEEDYGTALTLVDAKNVRAALDEAIAYVEKHGQAMRFKKAAGDALEAAHG